MNEKEKVKQAVSLSLYEGYHIDACAFDFLCTISKTEDPIELVRFALQKLNTAAEKHCFISKNLLEETAKDVFPEKALNSVHTDLPVLQKSAVETGKINKFNPPAKKIKKRIKILEDPTNQICSTGSIEEYLKYFQDRFKRMRRLLRHRMDSRDAGSIKDVFRAATHSDVKVLCMVAEKRGSKYGVFLLIEDLKSSATVLVPRNASQELLEKVKSLLPDQVVCLSLTKRRKSRLIVKDLFFPDIPQRRPPKAEEPVCAALISDLHVGSREFMREEFNKFLLWLNGKHGNETLRAVAGLVKYIIIAGDLVDGVGIYPGQIEELAVKDISKQYELVAKFLEQIPDYIEVIVIPGNHDASRKALPQPALPKYYSKLLQDSCNILSLGNPASLSIHGLEFLVYHGRSLDDVLATAANMDFSSPERAMRLLLQGRHLAPIYGQRTAIAPEKQDFLVIDRVPDVFHAGHVHVMKYESYRGTLLVNSGAWQRQTSYQRKLGLKPTPGIIPVVNLQTSNILTIDFA